jgi:hypothetical protein
MISSESSTTGAVKLPTFDGDSKNYKMFARRFKAYAEVKNFGKALEYDSADPNLPSRHSAATNAAERQAVQRNNTAMACLTMALETEELLMHVDETITEEWPNGQAWLTMKTLKQE